MTQLFSNPAGRQLLSDLREVFEEKKIFLSQHRFILFVCGGTLEEASLRSQFIQWSEDNLPEFICLKAEDALNENFAGEGRVFVNLITFESIVADVADCVLIFPESVGSYAETGFFAKSEISKKTLVVNPLSFQSEDSFLNLGPIDAISDASFLRPTVLINTQEEIDFSHIGQRLKQRVKWPERRERLPYQKFGQFNFKQKLLVVFALLRLLRLADLKTLRHVLVTCFGGNPQYQELTHLLRILLAAKFIVRDQGSSYFKVVAGLDLIEIEHVEVERVLAQVLFFYKRHSPDLYDALLERPA